VPESLRVRWDLRVDTGCGSDAIEVKEKKKGKGNQELSRIEKYIIKGECGLSRSGLAPLPGHLPLRRIEPSFPSQESPEKEEKKKKKEKNENTIHQSINTPFYCSHHFLLIPHLGTYCSLSLLFSSLLFPFLFSFFFFWAKSPPLLTTYSTRPPPC
jgi:hypothetical protein